MGRDLTRWLSASSAVRGRAHENSGVPCQDVVGRSCAKGVAAVALADGAGSAKHAAEGARVAVKASLAVLTDRFDTLITANPLEARRIVLASVLNRLADRAIELEADAADLSSTLLFVAVGGGRFLAGHVGDGLIGVARDEETAVLSLPARGEFANETTFVAGIRTPRELRVFRGSTQGVMGFVLMSDGAAESLFERRSGRLAGAVDRFFAWLDEHSPQEVSRALEGKASTLLRGRTGDDCSVAVLRRVNVDVLVLPERGVDFQRAMLGCGNRRGAANRLRVAQAIAGGIRPIDEIAQATGLSTGTVRKHLLELASAGVDSAACSG